MELLGQIASVSAVAFVWAIFAQARPASAGCGFYSRRQRQRPRVLCKPDAHAAAQEVIILATTRAPGGQQMVPGTVDEPNQLTQDRLFGLYTGALLTSGIANSISARFLDWMTVLCAWFCRRPHM